MLPFASLRSYLVLFSPSILLLSKLYTQLQLQNDRRNELVLPERDHRPRHRRHQRHWPSHGLCPGRSRRRHYSGSGTRAPTRQQQTAINPSQRDTTNTATKDEITNRLGRKAWIHVAELGDRQAVKNIVPALTSQGLKPQILVNCAGIQRRHPSEQFPDEDWDEVRPNIDLTIYLPLCPIS